MFKLSFLINNQDSKLAKIEIGDFSENLSSTFEYWTENRYLDQWFEAVNRIRNGCSCSAFITSITNPKDSNFLWWWVCYENNEKILFQEHVLFLNELATPFSEDIPYDSIPGFEGYSEEGEKISSWSCSKKEVLDFGKVLEEARI